MGAPPHWPTSPDDDPQEAQRGASDPAASVWVAASAGTGKTKVLTDRVLRLMLDGTEPRRILCLTYTKAAAAEMANRIAERLRDWVTAGDDQLDRLLFELLGRTPSDRQRRRARELFARVLDSPGGLSIQTIHAFCQSLLGRFPLEAQIAPHATVMDDGDSLDLLRQARLGILDLAERPGAPIAGALATATRHLGEGRFAELAGALAADRGRFEAVIEAHGSVDAAAQAVHRLLGLPTGATPASAIADACEEAAFDGSALRRAADALARGSEPEQKRAAILAAWLAAEPAERAATFDFYAGCFLTQDDPPQPRKSLINKPTLKKAPGADEALQAEASRLEGVLARRRAAVIAEATEALLILGHALLAAYRQLKDRRALLDYTDLIERAARLLGDEGSAAWVLFKLDGGIDHVLIDEAQDTSPAQWRIVTALTAEFFAGEGARPQPRTVFAVGDVKQSIYSFQGADPRSFLDSRDRFAARVTGAKGDWRPFEMKTSFRSTRAVLAAVDATFAAPDMAHSIALADEDIVHRAFRLRDGGLVEVWPPVAPRPADPLQPWEPPVSTVGADSPPSRLALLIALRIEAMLQGGERLESAGRPIEGGDIMVLVRRRTGPFMATLVRALKERQLPVAGIDRMLLNEQLVVMDLMALGRVALLPTDDLTLATALKGPLFGFDDDELFALAWRRTGTLWSALQARAANDPHCAGALALLSELLAMADRVPPFEFFIRVLGPLPGGGDGTDSGRRRLLTRLGRDAEDPLAEFLELALAYERTRPPSLQGFLHWLDNNPVSIKRDPEQGSHNAVRVMTVHGAKGLQAPIVFLPDTCQVENKTEALLWPEAPDGRPLLLWPPRRAHYEGVADDERQRRLALQKDEHRRLLYVAMTRASDRLIVCGALNRKQMNGPPDDCWYSTIRRGMKTAADAGRLELQEVEADPFLAARPDLIDEARVLRHSCPQDDVRAPKATAASVASEPLPAWALRPPPEEPPAPRPLRPSHGLEGGPPGASPVLSPLADAQRFRRGRLIHRLLQELPDLPPEVRLPAARRWLARPTHGLDGPSQEQIAAEVTAVLDDPRFSALFGPGSRAEVPLSGTVGGLTIAGQIDRLLVETDTVTVLDYKSDRPAPRSAAGVPPAYLRQMAAYRALLRRVYPGRRVRCLLLWTEVPLALVLDDGALDRWEP